MLTSFNRREPAVTMDMQRPAELRNLPAAAGVPYTVRTHSPGSSGRRLVPSGWLRLLFAGGGGAAAGPSAEPEKSPGGCLNGPFRDNEHDRECGDLMKRRLWPVTVRRTVTVLLAFLFLLSGCKKAETAERETVRVFSRLLPENALFWSEDGGVWGLDHRDRKREEGELERVFAQRYGPVFLPETEDVGQTLRLHITGIREYSPAYAKRPDWWFLDYTYEQADEKPKTVTPSLQIRLDGQWYCLPFGGLTPEWIQELPGSLSLMKGRLDPEETEQIIPGHYRLVLYRDWRGEISLDAEEFDLIETEDGFAVDRIRKPADLFGEKAAVPAQRVLREDGSSWRLAEAGVNDFRAFILTDILEEKSEGRDR